MTPVISSTSVYSHASGNPSSQQHSPHNRETRAEREMRRKAREANKHPPKIEPIVPPLELSPRSEQNSPATHTSQPRAGFHTRQTFVAPDYSYQPATAYRPSSECYSLDTPWDVLPP